MSLWLTETSVSLCVCLDPGVPPCFRNRRDAWETLPSCLVVKPVFSTLLAVHWKCLHQSSLLGPSVGRWVRRKW